MGTPTTSMQLAPDLAQVHASRGLALSYGPRQDEAEQAFIRAVELDPTLFDAYYFHGRHAFSMGKHESAARLFEMATAVRPDDYQALALLAQVYRALGQDEKRNDARRRTLEVIERRIKTSPNDTRALSFGSINLLEDGQTEKGMEWLERAKTAMPDEAGCASKMGGLGTTSPTGRRRSCSIPRLPNCGARQSRSGIQSFPGSN